MRERLVLAFVSLAVCIIGLYGIPRAFMVVDTVRDSEHARTDATARLVAVALGEYERRGDVTQADLQALVVDPSDRIDYAGPDGQRVSAGVPLSGDPEDVSISVAVPGGGTATVGRSGRAISERVQSALAPVLVIGLALLVISAFVALVLARFISAPFARLAAAARELGEGRLDVKSEGYRIPEAQAIAAALSESGRALKERIRREHEFAANASHQLRTPITALRLELEDLSLWKETPAPVAEQLGRALTEVDRLSAAIQELLEHARGTVPGAAKRVPLGPLLTDTANRWRTEAASQSRSIECGGKAPAQVPAPASQILDVLVHNALRHGRGTVTLRAALAPGYVRISVGDEGPRPVQRDLFERSSVKTSKDGEGIGLSLASELAEALGGHLVLDSGPTTSFTLMLPN
jgi:signal transduction histidine kinase